MRNRRLWRPVGCVAAVAAAAALAAGCSPSSPRAGPNGSQSPGPVSVSPGPVSVSPGPTSPRPSASASSDSVNSAAQRAAEAVQGQPAVATPAQLAALKDQAAEIARLSPEQMAGQRVIYSYSGLTAPSALLDAIRHGDVGGVIFFGSNISSQQQISSVIQQMIAANDSPQNPARHYPLLLMTDQEGGVVRRLPWAGPVQSEAEIGESASPATAAATAGQQAATALRAVGMNVNLAPVLDVYRQAGGFDAQYQRSYSMNPAVVSSAGAAFISAQQADGVAATVKHFPGLGAATASQNTDTGPVTLDLSKAVLQQVDEYPYAAAVRAGVKLAMVSWARYPALDPRLPAGLSPLIVQGQLEDRVGYHGVTITDALGAGALASYGSLQNRAMLAARAGMDALLCTADQPLPGSQCLDGVENGYAEGVLPKTAFKAQLAQLLELRASLPG